nr:mucin-4-like [Dermacentor andersoni]
MRLTNIFRFCLFQLVTASSPSTAAAPYRCCNGALPHVLHTENPAQSDASSASISKAECFAIALAIKDRERTGPSYNTIISDSQELVTASSPSTAAAPYRCCNGALPHVLHTENPAPSDASSADPRVATPAPVPVTLPGRSTASPSTSTPPLYLNYWHRPQQFSGHGNNATMRLTNIFRSCLFQLVTASSPSTAAAPYRCCNGALPHVLHTENPAPSDASSAEPRVATPAPVPLVTASSPSTAAAPYRCCNGALPHVLPTENPAPSDASSAEPRVATPAPVPMTLPGRSTASPSTSTPPLYLNYWHRPQQFSGHGNNATMRLTNIFRSCLFQLVTASSPSTAAAPYRCCNGALPHVLHTENPAPSDASSAEPRVATPAPVPLVTASSPSTAAAPYRCCNGALPHVLHTENPAPSDASSTEPRVATPAPVPVTLPGRSTASPSTSTPPLYLNYWHRPQQFSGHGNNATMRLTNIFRSCLFQLVTASSPSTAAAPYRCCNGALPHVLHTENPAPSDASSADPRVATPAPVPVTLPGRSTASPSTSTPPLYLNYWHRPQQFSGHGNNATMRLTNIFRSCLFQLVTASSPSTAAAPYRCCNGALPHVLHTENPAPSDASSAEPRVATPAPVPVTLPGRTTASPSTSTPPLYLNYWHRPQQFSGHGNNATMRLTNIFRSCLFQLVTASSPSTAAAPYRCCNGALPHVLHTENPAPSDASSAEPRVATPAPVPVTLPGRSTASPSTSTPPLYLNYWHRPQQFSGHGNNATMRLTNIFRSCLFQLVTASSPSTAAAPYRCCNGALPHVLHTENPAPSDASSAEPRVATPAPVPVTLPGRSTASPSTSTPPLYLNYWHRPQQFSLLHIF